MTRNRNNASDKFSALRACRLTVLCSFVFCVPLAPRTYAQNVDAMAIPQPRKFQQKKILKLTKQVLADPAIAETLRNGELQYAPREETAEEANSKTVPEYTIFDYKIITKPQRNFAQSFFMGVSDDGAYRLSLFSSNDELKELTSSPDWEKLKPEWDAFVAKYWPGLKPRTLWQNAIKDYEADRGLFTLTYDFREQNLILAQVRIDIRLADGKIGGFNIDDQRPRLRRHLQGRPIPPAPDRGALMQAVRSALVAHDGEHEYNLALEKDVKIKESSRRYGRVTFDRTRANEKPTYVSDLVVVLRQTNGHESHIIFEYEESTRKAFMGGIAESNTPVVSEIALPRTLVRDSSPKWGVDGRKLYFATTRDVAGRPWWQRYAPMSSIVVASNLEKEPTLKLIRPLHPLYDDLLSYDLKSAPGKNGRITASLNRGEDQIIFIDEADGTCLFPSQSEAWKERMLKQVPGQAYLPKAFNWFSREATNANASPSVILSIDYGTSKNDLYAAVPVAAAPAQFELIPIVRERGTQLSPCLSPDDKLLAYVQVTASPKKTQEATQSKDIRLVVGDFHSATSAISNKRSLVLASQPVSISWDTKLNSWLIVLENGEVQRIAERGGSFTVSKLPQIKWGDHKLKPISADVSPASGIIAVAAELDTKHVFDNTSCILQSQIFLWDGVTEQVTPAFEPSLNGIPRLKFPNGNHWATIIGNVKSASLENIVDLQSISKE